MKISQRTPLFNASPSEILTFFFSITKQIQLNVIRNGFNMFILIYTLLSSVNQIICVCG